jgi:hypothetical protein
MTATSIEPFARLRATLHVELENGRRVVRGNVTDEERAALRAVMEALLRELSVHVAFDRETDVQWAHEFAALIQTDDGTQVVLDPLSILPLLSPSLERKPAELH